MKALRSLAIAGALVAACGAQAAVVGSLGGGTGPFLSLAPAGPNVGDGGTLGGGFATITNGTIYNSDLPFADIPAGAVFENNFLSAGPGPDNAEPTTLHINGAGTAYLSFLWGSPDDYNTLTVMSTGGGSPQVFSVASLGLPGDGNQSFSAYVQFMGVGTDLITDLIFSNSPPINAFETANYSVTAVPEPETYALMLAGLGVMGWVARRRRG